MLRAKTGKSKPNIDAEHVTQPDAESSQNTGAEAVSLLNDHSWNLKGFLEWLMVETANMGSRRVER